MKKIFILVLAAMLILAGCSGNTKPVSKPNSNSENPGQAGEAGYSFKYKTAAINMNDKAAPIVESLGKSMDYFEAESCAFKGLDKIYYYSGFELHTYPIDNVDYVSSVLFTDDSVSTPEGVSIGSSLDDMVKAYGNGYTQESGVYRYTKGKSKLSFIIENNAVASIEYLAITGK
jgi:hypothetical protein